MKERPILFSGEMVRSILEGRKTMTRRIIKNIPDLIYDIQDDRILVLHNKDGKNENEGWNTIGANPSFPEQRLYGWRGWEYIFTYQIQRFWSQGVRGLVCAFWSSEQQRLSNCFSLPRKHKGDEACSQADLHGVSRNAESYNVTSSTLGRKSEEQQSKKSEMGNTRGKLAGSENSWNSNGWGETLGFKAYKQRERAFILGNKNRLVFSAPRREGFEYEPIGYMEYCKYQKGMKVWVREIWRMTTNVTFNGDSVPMYKATYNEPFQFTDWKSPIFMPRWSSRITLEIVNIRVERLQDISKIDCIAEGMLDLEDIHAGWHQSYAALWNSINAKRGYGWGSNPWVWVIEFKKVW